MFFDFSFLLSDRIAGKNNGIEEHQSSPNSIRKGSLPKKKSIEFHTPSPFVKKF